MNTLSFSGALQSRLTRFSFIFLGLLTLQLWLGSANATAPLTYRGTFHVWGVPLYNNECPDNKDETTVQKCVDDNMKALGYTKTNDWAAQDAFPCTGIDSAPECNTAHYEPSGGYTAYLDLVCADGGSPILPSGQHYAGLCMLPGTPPPCENGQVRDSATQECISPGVRNSGCPDCSHAQGGSKAGDPINPGNGNAYFQVTDYRGGGPFPLIFSRSYNSGTANDITSSGAQANVGLGIGWTSNISTRTTQETPLHQCQLPPDTQYVCPMAGLFYTSWRPDGSQDKFWIGNDHPPAGVGGLSASGPTPKGMWEFNNYLVNQYPFTYVRSDQYTEFYDFTGKLMQVQDPHGLTQTYSYSYATIGGVSILQSITVADPTGRQMVLNYNTTTGRLSTLVVPGFEGFNTLTISYQYDASGNLQYVTYADNSKVEYRYDDATYPHALTGIVDESNVGSNIEYTTWSYDDSTGKAICSAGNGRTNTRCDQDPNVVERVLVAYNGDGSADVTEVTGLVRHLTYQTFNNVNVLHTVSRRCIDCGDRSKEIDYDTVRGQPNKIIDFNNHEIDYGYTDFGVVGSETDNPSDPSNYRQVYSWFYSEPQGGETPFPTKSWIQPDNTGQDPLRFIQYCYNVASDGTCNDFTGGMGNVWSVTVSDPVNSSLASRVTTYTYASSGLLKSVAGPRIVGGNPVTTTYGFYTADSISNGNAYKKNDLKTITDPAGNITQVTIYDQTGRPLSMTDPNGVDTDYQYDARQRLYAHSVQIPGTGSLRGQTYYYFPNGLLQKVVFNDFPYFRYEYDNAHRLTAVYDEDGNKITYTYTVNTTNETYDVEEQRFDPTGTLTYDHHRTRDDLNDQVRDVDAYGHTTTYQYDANGNVVGITDPNGKPTQQQFDSRNRLVSITDPQNGITSFNIDALDHMIDVTDPHQFNTHYAWDTFDDVLEVDSPDTGTTTYTYDRGGNVANRTNSAGYSAVSTYDVLGRIKQTQYKNASGTVTTTTAYTYDQTGSNGFANIGYLTGITDGSGSTTYTYDAWGDVYQKVSTIGTVSFPVNYRYDQYGDLSTIWFGNTGSQFLYSYDNELRISQVRAKNGTTGVTAYALASGVTYAPYGGVKGFTYGNSLAESRSYDLAYRLSNITVPNVYNRTFGYDAAGNIQTITDNLHSSNNQTLAYDSLNRLVSAQGAYGSLTIGPDPVNHPELSYDANGNRTQTTLNGVTTFYNYATGSNRLMSLTGGNTAAYTYNAFGSITNDGTYKYSYDATERMTLTRLASNNSTLDIYTYNGLGQRVMKVGSSTAMFIYDEQGHLLAELNGSGGVTRSHLWMGDKPLAWFNNGDVTATNARYIHSDQLDTPRAMTDNTGAVGWTWESDPFGNGAPVISGFGSSYKLRFPGQYADAEAGKSYNYFRDYDSITDRYIESDPAGLRGGVNTYSYAMGNPIGLSDPYGLYSSAWHKLFTEVGAQVAGVDARSAAALGQMVADVDNGTQGEDDAIMHAMCPDGESPVDCGNDFQKYLKKEVGSCTVQGLAKALHGVQDSVAAGHRGFQPYSGFWHLVVSDVLHGLPHYDGDNLPSPADQSIVTSMTTGLIKRFEKKCGCNVNL